MMSRIKICITLACAAALACSCVDDPEKIYPAATEISIARLKELYAGHPVTIEENYVVTGTVISSDQFGNFYKSLVLEDSTAGIEIRLDMAEIFKTYSNYSRVRVYCRGLTVGAYGKMIQLGAAPAGGYEAGRIARDEVGDHLLPAGAAEDTPEGIPLTFADLTTANAGRILCRRVVFSGVRFAQADGAVTWCDPEEDTDRTLVDAAGNTLAVRTLRYADFAQMPLPEGELYIAGVLSWFNDAWQLRVVRLADVQVTGE